ncbi:hypothetical protein QQP08_022431 [Theobroma cacao]|nr:hypothetical protein QQP08_022431 [Theobroma cacao]
MRIKLIDCERDCLHKMSTYMAYEKQVGSYWWQEFMPRRPMKVNARNFSHHRNIYLGVYIRYLNLKTLIFGLRQREPGMSAFILFSRQKQVMILAFNYMKVTEQLI